MCLGSPIKGTSTLVGTSTWPADSLCLCCFWQVVRCLWSRHVSRIPITRTSSLAGTSTWSAASFCLCWFWQVATRHLNFFLVGMSSWPASSFCLCCFWQAVKQLWSLHVSRISRHTELLPGRNVYQSSWFILSMLFLTGGETSLVPTHV